jgi:O-antigen/teichoic acid export membrane protein
VICLPSGLGIALLAEPLVGLLLGPAWLEAVPLVEALVLYGLMRAGSTITGPVYLALGRVRIEPALLALYLAMLLPLLPLLVVRLGVIGAVLALSLCAAVNLALNLVIASRLLGLGAGRIAAVLWRTLLAAAAMAAGVAAAAAAVEPPLARLVAGIGVGLPLFVASLLGLWWLCGRPAGAERTLLARLGELVDRLPRGRAAAALRR